METNTQAMRALRPSDFTIAVHVSAGDTYEWSNVLLARVSPDGLLELLTAAWERLLGYGRREFTGKTLRQLMRPGERADVVAAILDHHNMEPVDLTLLCRDGRPKHLRLHRRFDEYGHKMFIVAEEASPPMCANAQMPRPAAASLDA
jgi:PAS domain-containing protein